MLSFDELHTVVATGRGVAPADTLEEAIAMTNRGGVSEAYYLQQVRVVIFHKEHGYIALTANGAVKVAISWMGLWQYPRFEEFFTTVFLNGIPTMRLLELLDISATDHQRAEVEFEILLEIALQGRRIKDLGTPR
jgi:hypothetical protein